MKIKNILKYIFHTEKVVNYDTVKKTTKLFGLNICSRIHSENKYIVNLLGYPIIKRKKPQHIDELFKIKDELFMLKEQLKNIPNNVYHLSAFCFNNAGDNILVPALRQSIDISANKKNNFIHRNCRLPLTQEDIYFINQSNGIILGGGGLFLKDTNQNEISGWQCPISIENLEDIKVPIAMLGVGYNRFRGQDEFENVFYENINKFVEKAVFIGLRNNGSIRELKKYLKPELHSKIIYHPCATTILSKIYDLPKTEHENFITVQCAFDREYLRYGEKEDEILNSIAKVIKELSKKYKIKYYCHLESDIKILPYFDKYNTEYEMIELNKGLSEQDFLDLYSKPALCIGMRGHAQMIPFGCGTPILSIISHDKLKWFLEDIEHPEWGVDILQQDFEEDLLNKANKILLNIELTKMQINQAQKNLFKITSDNIKNINFLNKE